MAARYVGPINLKPLQGLKHPKLGGDGIAPRISGPNQPQTLTGIETWLFLSDSARVNRPNQPQTLTGIETNNTDLKPWIKPSTAQSTSNPYRD